MLEKSEIKQLTKLNPAKAILHIVEIWLTVGLCFALAFFLPAFATPLNFLIYLCTVIVIASRQHALLVLTHDAIHFRIAKSKKVNDILSQLLLAFPILVSLQKWRFIHLYHHQYTYTDKDPDVAIFGRYPIAKQKLHHYLIKDFFGLNIHHTYKYFTDVPFLTVKFNKRFLGEERFEKYQKVKDISFFYVFWFVAFSVGFLLIGLDFLYYFVLYWFIPFATFLQVFLRLRGALEHGAVANKNDELLQTRTYILGPFLAYFFAPKYVNYHLEHHLYPNIPFYNLPKLHKYLAQEKYDKKEACIQTFGKSLKALMINE